jgi:hypothetical protein
MTNTSAGSKRSWKGHAAESHSHKRHRDEPRDWRDVHLKSPTDKRSKSSSSRRDSIDKRDPGRSREDPRRPSDHSRDWDRDKDRRDGRDHDRDRERDRNRARSERFIMVRKQKRDYVIEYQIPELAAEDGLSSIGAGSCSCEENRSSLRSETISF